jgi:hypothetical protein
VGIHFYVEAQDAERLLGVNLVDIVYTSYIGGGYINISSNNKAQPIGLGKVRKYRNYREDLHPVGLRYTPTSTLGCHSMYIGDKNLV